jgi:N-acetylmuramoyl-L-alanine amidase
MMHILNADLRAEMLPPDADAMGKAVLRLIFTFFLVAFAFFGSSAAQATEVRSVGIAALSDGAVAIVIDATAAAPVSASALTKPDRLVLDVPNVAYVAEARGGTGRGFVSHFRIGEAGARQGAGTRIVLMLEEPALAESIDVVPGAVGARMIIKLAKANRQAFDVAVASTREPEPEVTGTVESASDNPTADENAPDQTQPGEVLTFADNAPDTMSQAEAASGDTITVVIDAGHGGIDPGAVNRAGLIEKDVTLAFAKVLQETLGKSPKYKIVVTRSDDSFVSLDDRVKIARDNKADLFISIHADTLSDEPGVRGSTVYTLNEKASDARSARLAEKENAVDTLGGVMPGIDDAQVSDILFDLTRRETRQFSNKLAQSLVSRLKETISVNKNPLRGARFRVLTAPDVPSVLVELGYLSSDEDARLITSPEWQKKTADATLKAIEDFTRFRQAAQR